MKLARKKLTLVAASLAEAESIIDEADFIMSRQQQEMAAKDALNEKLLAASKAVVSHWNEFGPECEFCVEMDRLEKAILLRPLECIKCGIAAGPLHPLEGDHAGWMCHKCGAELDKKAEVQ